MLDRFGIRGCRALRAAQRCFTMFKKTQATIDYPHSQNSSAVQQRRKTLRCHGARRGAAYRTICAVLLSVSLSCLFATHVRAAQYVYDEVGRLIQVVAADGSSVQYSYDALGNITAIKRNTAAVSISEFTPDMGPIGAQVTIYGTGFSTTAAANNVSFNGVPATVSTATATSLAVAVPSGAISGKITITNSNGSATSASDFVVSAAQQAPTITGFTPAIGTAGTAVTIAGTNFNPTAIRNNVKFNDSFARISTATATQLQTSVPTLTASGPIKVTTASGTVTSATDFIVPPPGRTAADIASSGRLFVDGAPLVTSVPTANKIGLFLFSGKKGQHLGLGVTGVSTVPSGGTFKVYLDQPNGSLLFDCATYRAPIGSAGNDCDLPTLPVDGSYTLRVEPIPDTTANFTLTLSSDQTGILTMNGPTLNFNGVRPGQNALYTFNATAGQNISFALSHLTFTNDTYFHLNNPDGSELSTNHFSGSGTGTTNVITQPNLSQTGTYTMWVNPVGTGSGSVGVNLMANATGTIDVDGAPVVINLSAGQNGDFYFDAVAGQRLSLGISPFSSTPTGGAITVYVDQPGYTNFYTCGNYSTAGTCDVPPLPATGKYRIRLTGAPAQGINFTATLSSEQTGTLTPDSVTHVSFNRVGQNGRYTFNATAGQSYSLALTNMSPGATTNISIFNPDGSPFNNVWNCAGFTATSGNCDVSRIPTTGTYSILLDPAGVATPTFDAWLSTTMNGGALTIGTPVTFSTNAPGQNGAYTFSGTAGQNLSLVLSNSTIAAGSIYVFKPDGTALTTRSLANGLRDLPALPVTGTYQVMVFVDGVATGHIDILLRDTYVNGTIAVDGASVPFNLAAGQSGAYYFDAVAGQRLSLGISAFTSAPAGSSVKVYVDKPDYTNFFTCGTYSAQGTCDIPPLPVTGKYRFWLDGASAQGINFTATLSSEQTGTLTLDSVTHVSLNRVGQNGRYTFNATAGQSYSLALANMSAGATTNISIFNPDGSPSNNGVYCSGFTATSGNCDVGRIPTTGTYSILLNPAGVAAPTFDAWLSTDLSGGALTIGTPVTFSTNEPGQNGAYTFSGTAGQNLSLAFSNNTIATGTIYVLKPDGTVLNSRYYNGLANGTLTLPTLPATGSYLVMVYVDGVATGHMDVLLGTR